MSRERKMELDIDEITKNFMSVDVRIIGGRQWLPRPDLSQCRDLFSAINDINTSRKRFVKAYVDSPLGASSSCQKSMDDIINELEGIVTDPIFLNIYNSSPDLHIWQVYNSLADTLELKKVSTREELLDCFSVSFIGGGFKVARKIGSGAMMEVYEVKDYRGDCWAAKFFRGKKIDYFLDAFKMSRDDLIMKSSWATIANIKHPNVASHYLLKTLSGEPVLIEEIMEGTLEDRLNEGPFSFEQTRFFGLRILEGLRAIHNMGVVHQDLKPSNIGIKKIEGYLNPVLFDFGISSHFPGNNDKRSEMGGLLIRAPELFDFYEPSPQSDIYSFGCVLFRTVTGIYPALVGTNYSEKTLPREPGKSREETASFIRDKVKSPNYFHDACTCLWNLPYTGNSFDRELLLLAIQGCIQPEKAKRFKDAGEAFGELAGLEISTLRRALFGSLGRWMMDKVKGVYHSR